MSLTRRLLRTVQSQNIKQPFLLQLQLVIDLSPHPQPAVRIPRVRHRLIHPYPVEVPAPSLSTLHAHSLSPRVWFALDARRGVQDCETALLRRDAEVVCEEHGDGLHYGLAVHVPDAAVHVARMKAINVMCLYCGCWRKR